MSTSSLRPSRGDSPRLVEAEIRPDEAVLQRHSKTLKGSSQSLPKPAVRGDKVRLGRSFEAQAPKTRSQRSQGTWDML